jgi:phage terminase large subunit
VRLDFEVPRAFKPLLSPARYKAAFGGRGGAKSHFFAEQLILRCVQKRTRWACIREVQNSLKESVQQLLLDKIAKFGVSQMFDPVESEIRCPHGGLIIFKGMQSYNADNVKSLEDYDGAWVAEAQTMSDRSLRILRPTIRRASSELWFDWNPRHDTDAIDVFLRQNPPPDAAVVNVSWRDNPWFPDVLKREKDHDYATDPDMAEHVWGGGYERISEASYYGRWIADAEKEGRIGHFPYRPELPVITSWDIGVDDYTAIWFWQEDGETVTVVDYYETQNDGAPQIIRDALPEYHDDMGAAAVKLVEIGRERPWRYGEHYFPHDVKVREWGAGARSRVDALVELGLRNIRKGAAVAPEERINAMRMLLPITRFNATKRVQVGISRLRRYSRRFNELMGQYMGPAQDGNQHGADAAGEFAVNCPLLARVVEKPKRQLQPGQVMLPGPPQPVSTRRFKL